MNTNMSAIYITQTGHVTGAVTCNSNSSRALAVADVATPSFLLSRVGTLDSVLRTFSLPPSVCSVSAPIAYNRSLFLSSNDFEISGSVFQGLSQDLSGSPPTLTQTSLTVNTPSAVIADTMVFAQIEGPVVPGTPPQETCVIAGKIAAGQASANLPLTILPGGAPVSVPAGQYAVIVLIAAYKPFSGSIAA